MSNIDVFAGFLLKVSMIGLLFVLLATVCNACYINDCICLNSDIICQNEDEAAPLFTSVERFAVNNLYMSQKQKEWIMSVCGMFTRLIKVAMLDGSPCPQESCLPCR
jgi:hypothetical protein